MTPGLLQGDRLVTMTSVAALLDFRGKRRQEAARKWVMRHGLPRWFRGRAFLVRVSDIERVLMGDVVARSSSER